MSDAGEADLTVWTLNKALPAVLKLEYCSLVNIRLMPIERNPCGGVL